MRRAPGAPAGPSARRGPGRVPAPEAGQAAVELALVLPLVLWLALALVQVALVARDQVLLTHAAREGAREAAVEPDAAVVRRAVRAGSRLAPDRLTVEVGRRGAPGSRVEVVVRYRSPTAVPLAGSVAPDVELTASAVMRVER